MLMKVFEGMGFSAGQSGNGYHGCIQNLSTLVRQLP